MDCACPAENTICYCDERRSILCRVCGKNGTTLCAAGEAMSDVCGDCSEPIYDRIMDTRRNADPKAPYVSTDEHATFESLMAKLEKIEKGEELSTPVVCPDCKGAFKVQVASEHDMWGATLDCAHCGALLIADEESKSILNFHKHMHDQNPIWPTDGKNCGSIDI